MAGTSIRSFQEFWPFYLREHRHPATRFWHFCGTTAAIVLLVVAIVLRQWTWVIGVPLCGYGFAWISHLFIEHNRPASFKYPLWSLLGDLKMWGLTVTGRMKHEVRRILES